MVIILENKTKDLKILFKNKVYTFIYFLRLNLNNTVEDWAKLTPIFKLNIKKLCLKFKLCIKITQKWKHKPTQWKLRFKIGKLNFKPFKDLKTDNYKNSDTALKTKRNLNLKDKWDNFKWDLMPKEVNSKLIPEDSDKDYNPKTDKIMISTDKFKN